MFPKIIWRYWAQGWNNAPFVVQECSKSIIHYAPDWKVINLDNTNIHEYITIPMQIDQIQDFPIQCRSDLIRMLLLKEHGGVWIDTTAFLNTNLTNFLSPINCDFFYFCRWENKTTMSNWFMAAQEDSYIARIMSEKYQNYILSDSFLNSNKSYFKRWKGSPNYFCFHKLFEEISHNDVIFKKKIDEMPFFDSTPMLQSVFTGWNKDVPFEVSVNVLNDIPLVKLSHAIKETEYNKNSVLGILIRKGLA